MAAKLTAFTFAATLICGVAVAQDAAIYSDMDRVHPVWARSGMVATQEAVATGIGVDILKRGGNAVDAAVAVGFALAVTLPQAGNLGGGGFMIVHDAETGENVAIDYREKRRAAPPATCSSTPPEMPIPRSPSIAAWRSACPALWPDWRWRWSATAR